jgi:hypothetical protein
MIVYLVPIGRGRFELYSEPPDEPPHGESADGFFRRQARRVAARWREAVHAARAAEPRPRGRLARWRDALVCRLAETVAEQRTLWALRHAASATAIYPADLDVARAQAILTRSLARARIHHLRWLVVDTLLLIASGLLVLVPGPNLLAYYFAFRVGGHFLSWRGAGQAIDRTAWSQHPEPALAALAALAELPRDLRAPRVHAIAATLKLSRLTAFFDRAAVPAA